jgi:glycosyltransferase involved in cell wall biosynthesis
MNQNKVLLISLQKFGGGAQDSLGLSNGLCENKFFHHIIISADNELANKFTDNEFRKVYKIKTYTSDIKDFLKQTILLKRPIGFIKTIKKIKPKIIYITHFHPWIIFAFCLRKIYRFKIFYTCHDNPFEPKESPAPFMNFLEKIFTKNANLVITHSNFVKNGIEKYLKNKKIIVLHLGIYERICYVKEKFNLSGPINLLFFGRIEEYKGLDILIEAFEILKRKNLDIFLTIAGRGQISKTLLHKIHSLNINLKNYWLSNEELCDLLNKADVLIAPYKQSTQSGIVITALTYGIPIIATDVGANREFIEDGKDGFLVKPNDPEDLVKKIELIYNNRDLLEEFNKNLLVKSKFFEWSFITQKLIEVYREIY